jgi:hypothetical protein
MIAGPHHSQEPAQLVGFQLTAIMPAVHFSIAGFQVG